MAKLNLIVAGEIYSQNLGDGVIFETTRYLIEQANPDVTVVPYDISRKRAWAGPQARKATATSLLSWIAGRCSPFYKLLMLGHYLRLRRKTLSPDNLSVFDNAGGVVIGGGQLLLDRSWNFPLKLHLVALAASQHRLSIHVFSCGVGPRWSWLGGTLFRRILSLSTSISLRDTISQERLHRLAPGTSSQVTADPALWAAETYPRTEPTEPDQERRVGLGVIHPWQIHGRNRGPISPEQWGSFWLETMRKLEIKGISYEVFTNGNPADYEFAGRIHKRARQKGLACSLATRPLQPGELAAAIRRYHAVLALRLHANIVAAAYHIPSVGLSWNEKVRGFYESLGYPHRCLPLDRLDSTKTVGVLLDALREGVDVENVACLKEKTRGNIQEIISQVTPPSP